jgi:DNA-binding Lrp family transcriptional regulator
VENFTIVLVALSSRAYRDPQKTANRLARYKEVERVDILTGNWDLALEVKTKIRKHFTIFSKEQSSKRAKS